MKHLPKHYRLHKICNKNIKISYSCMPNMSRIILSHNKKLFFTLPKANSPTTADPKCNCTIKTTCPRNSKCQQKPIVYKAEISFNNATKLYYGSCSTDLKRELVITYIHLPTEIKEMQPSYQKKLGKQRIKVWSHQ